MSEPSRKIVADMKTLIADAEELARASASETGNKVAEIRNRLQTHAAAIKPRLAQAEADLRHTLGNAASNAATYVRSNPWQAVGVAAFVGLVIGILASRR